MIVDGARSRDRLFGDVLVREREAPLAGFHVFDRVAGHPQVFAPPPLPNGSGGGGRQRESCRRLVHHADFRDSQLQVDTLPSARAPVAAVAPPEAYAATGRGGRGAQQRAQEALRSHAPSPVEVAARADGAAIELVEAELSERELSARGPEPEQESAMTRLPRRERAW